MNESTLGNWLARARARQQNVAPAQPEGHGPVSWEEHRATLAENERLKAEVELLGKLSDFQREATVTDFQGFSASGSNPRDVKERPAQARGM
ncbi:hypothetical protein ARTHRO9V_210220 [Arthrobacter sp. 9V]|uniref:hypothetical protein n=1 Tax=Arthrobacter sp. 9V TaxID=2653132 RepID=UPI0012EFD2A4|nr:hypothetical protein [Arthrobacter sp. 9V]VXC16302.1 hypothetical protein ARTHRO9V_210220 [Arthrobacter sp. 9V]